MKKAAWFLFFTIMVLIMTVAVFIYLAPHRGWQVNAVFSDSMEPELKVGSLAVTRPIDPEKVMVGDIITFTPISFDKDLISHRVVGIGHSSSLYFETQGDANGMPDAITVPAQNLIGKVCFHTPYWGYFTEFLKTPFGFLFAVVIPGVILIYSYMVAILQALRNNRKELKEVLESN